MLAIGSHKLMKNLNMELMHAESPGSSCLLFARIPRRINACPQAKKHQRGFWDRLENLQEQLDGFIAAELLQPGVVPRPAIMTEAGRTDLVRGVERWGGYKEVANLLGYEVSTAE